MAAAAAAAWLLLVHFPQLFRLFVHHREYLTPVFCLIILSRTAPLLFSCALVSHDGLRCPFARPHKDTVRTDDS